MFCVTLGPEMGSFLKNQEFISRDLQDLRNGKQCVQRDSLVDIRRFHMADERRCPLNTLRQFFLRQTAKLAFLAGLNYDILCVVESHTLLL